MKTTTKKATSEMYNPLEVLSVWRSIKGQRQMNWKGAKPKQRNAPKISSNGCSV